MDNSKGEIISECYYNNIDRSDEDYYLDYIEELHNKQIQNLDDTIIMLKDYQKRINDLKNEIDMDIINFNSELEEKVKEHEKNTNRKKSRSKN